MTFMREIGRLYYFLIQLLKVILKGHICYRLAIQHVSKTALKAISSICFAAIFVGSILLLQFYLILDKYQAIGLIGGLNTSTFIRGVGPLLIALLLAGRIGAYTAAELATMQVTQQIQAMECLGTDPLIYLIAPRWLGIVLSTLILNMFALSSSVLGSICMAFFYCGINELEYLASIPRFTSLSELLEGFFKSTIYATIVASVSCYYGFYAQGGAKGVGKAVTKTSIYTNIYIIIGNLVCTEVINSINKLIKIL